MNLKSFKFVLVSKLENEKRSITKKLLIGQVNFMPEGSVLREYEEMHRPPQHHEDFSHNSYPRTIKLKPGAPKKVIQDRRYSVISKQQGRDFNNKHVVFLYIPSR